jgi:hypothetical protein
MKGLHRRQALADAGVGLTSLRDGREELPVLEFDAVGVRRDCGDVDRLAVPVGQFVIASQVGALVADVPERASNGPSLLKESARVHRDPEGVVRATIMSIATRS